MSIWDSIKRGVVWLALYETGPSDDSDDEYEPQQRAGFEHDVKHPVCYLPPAEHNNWGTSPDYSVSTSSSDDDYSSASMFDNSFSSDDSYSCASAFDDSSSSCSSFE